MTPEAIFTNRRQHSRAGILGSVENITYSLLRKYQIPDSRCDGECPPGKEVPATDLREWNDTTNRPHYSLQQKEQLNQKEAQHHFGQISASAYQSNRERQYPEQWLVAERRQGTPCAIEHAIECRPYMGAV